jgi:AraC-like DNA-binding protein
MAGATPTHRPGTIERRRQLFEEATAIIALEYPCRLDLESVAHRIATSPRQLQRAFSEAGEVGFRGFLRRVRVERAAELLAGRMARRQRCAGGRIPAASAVRKAFRRERGCLPTQTPATAGST